MPGGTAELPILYRGGGSTVESKLSTSPHPSATHDGPHSVSVVFGSILRFLHIESGLPEDHGSPSSMKDSSNTNHKSVTDELGNTTGGGEGMSARSFASDGELVRTRGRTESRAPQSNNSSMAREDSLNQVSDVATSHSAERTSSSHATSNPHHRKSNFASQIASIFMPTKKKSKLRARSRSPLPSRKHRCTDDEDFLTAAIILENDEDEERSDLMQVEEAIRNILVMNFQSEIAVLKEKTIWNGEVGAEVSEIQLHTIYFMLFRHMKSLLSQQFSQIFPHGIEGTALSMGDVAACVAALSLVEMAITDDDIHSFAFSVFPGRRISLENCPPSKRYLYFMFMAFKSTVPSFRSHMDKFRSSVVKYFYDRNSIKKSGHPFQLPLQALLNATAPILHAAHFQKMTPPFYYYALSLEKERRGGSDAEEEDYNEASTVETPLMPGKGSLSHNGSVEFIIKTEAANPNPEVTTDPKVVSPLSPAPGATPEPAKIRRRQSTGTSGKPGQWSTIACRFKKASGEVIGQGAYGTVYRCYDESNGAFYALKEISLLNASMKRRIRHQQEILRQNTSESNPEASVSSLNPNASSSNDSHVKLSQLLTERERAEIRNRERAICGEINMLKTLRHPYIVSYYGCQYDPKYLRVSILMEYCPKTLRNIIDDVGALPLAMIAHYANQILQGINFLHDNHVVHRDIKSANILVKDGGEAKVSDFGTAMLNEMHRPATTHDDDQLGSLRRQASREEGEDLNTLFVHKRHHGRGAGGGAPASPVMTPTDASSFVIQGTPLFLAPEVANGCIPTEASDIWSFGCLLIEMASGMYPWHEWTGGNEMQLETIIFHIAMADAPPLLSPELAPKAVACEAFMDLLNCCLSLDPVARPTVRQLLAHNFFKVSSLEGDDGAVGTDGSNDLLGERSATGDLHAESGDVSATGGALNGNVMSIIPNDSMWAQPSGTY